MEVEHVLNYIPNNVEMRIEGCSSVGTEWGYSDRSQTTKRSSSMRLYPWHLCISDTSDGVKRKSIVSGDTVVTCLPAEFDVETVDNGATPFEGKSAHILSTEERMQVTPGVLYDILSPFVMMHYLSLTACPHPVSS